MTTKKKKSDIINGSIGAELLSYSNQIPFQVKERMYTRVMDQVTRVETHDDRIHISHRTMWCAACAGVFLLLLGAALTLWLQTYYHSSVKPESAETGLFFVQTQPGEHGYAVLPDRTEVTLNTMSSVTYQYDALSGERQAHVNGEAYFVIAKDAEHPFVIEADEVHVTCLGTALDVRNYQDETSTAIVLSEGKIQVSVPSSDILMDSNSRVVYNRGTKTMAMQRVNASDYTCWLNREVRFNNQTLAEVACELERNFHVQVIITKDELKDVRFTGYLGVSSLRNVLDIMSMSSNMSYYMDHDSVVYFCEQNKN